MANPSASGQGIIHNIGKYFVMLLVIAYIFTNSAIAYNDAGGNLKNIQWAKIIYPNYVKNIVTDVSSSFSSGSGTASTDTKPGDTISGNNPIIDSVIKNQNPDSTPPPKTENKTNPVDNKNPPTPDNSGEKSSGWSIWKWILVIGIIVIAGGTLTGVGLLYFGNRKIKPRKEPEGKKVTYKDILDMKCVIVNRKERTVREVIAFFYVSLKDIPSKDLVVDKIVKMFDKLRDTLNKSNNETFELTSSIVMTTSKLLHLFFDFITNLILLENLNITQSELIFNLVKEYEREISTKNNSKKTETDSNDKNSAEEIHEKNNDSKNSSFASDSSKVNIEDANVISEENKKNYTVLKKEVIDEKYVYSQLFVKYASLLKEDEQTIKKYAIEVARDIISEFKSAAKEIGFGTTLFKQIYETKDIKILESNLRNIFKMKKHTRDVLIAVLEKKREELLNSKIPSRVLVYGIIEELKNHGKELDKSLEGKLKESISAASTLQKIAKSWIVLNNVILRKNIEADNEIRKCIEKIDRFVPEDNENVDIILKNKTELEEILRVISKLGKYFDDEASSFKNVNKMIESMKDNENEKKEKKIEAIYGFAVEMHTKYHTIEEDITRRESNELITYVKVMSKIPEIKRYRKEIENEIKEMDAAKIKDSISEEPPVEESKFMKYTSGSPTTEKFMKYTSDENNLEEIKNHHVEFPELNIPPNMSSHDVDKLKEERQELINRVMKNLIQIDGVNNYYAVLSNNDEVIEVYRDLSNYKDHEEGDKQIINLSEINNELKNKLNSKIKDRKKNRESILLTDRIIEIVIAVGKEQSLERLNKLSEHINEKAKSYLNFALKEKTLFKCYMNLINSIYGILTATNPTYKKVDEYMYEIMKDIEKEKQKNNENLNFYNNEDFVLIINNQIALYKSTGQLCTLISVKINENYEDIIAHLGKMPIKDKITRIGDYVLIFILRSDESSINNYINKLKEFDMHYLTINDSIDYADQFVEKLLEEKTLPEATNEIEELKRIKYLRSIFGDIVQKKKNGDDFFFVEPVVGSSKETYLENVEDGSVFIVYKFANKFYMYWNVGIGNKEIVHFGEEKLGYDEFIIPYGKNMFGSDITTKEMRINGLIGYDMGEVKRLSNNRWLYEKVDKLDGHNTLVIPESNTTKVEKFYQGINKLELPDKYEMQDANAVAEWMENNGIEYNKDATLSLYAMSKEEIVELRGKLEALKKDENIAHTFKDVFNILTKRIDWLLRDGDKSYNETRDYYARMAEISTVSESSTTKQLKVKLEEAKEFSPVEKTVGKKPKKKEDKLNRKYILVESEGYTIDISYSDYPTNFYETSFEEKNNISVISVVDNVNIKSSAQKYRLDLIFDVDGEYGYVRVDKPAKVQWKEGKGVLKERGKIKLEDY